MYYDIPIRECLILICMRREYDIELDNWMIHRRLIETRIWDMEINKGIAEHRNDISKIY